MKIGYFADGPWSHLALERIVKDDDIQITFIVPRYDSQDPILREWAERLGVDYLPIQNVNDTKSIELLKGYGADLFVSMSFNQILAKEILAVTPLGFINCHAGALPYYRGRNILNWALINDEKQFGVTVHYIDEGIDTGDIILQKMADITDQDDYASLLDKAITLCADLLFHALVGIKENRVKRTPQSEIDPVGFYCGRRRAGDEWIDWNWTSRRIFNFIRALTEPGPCARTLLNDNEVTVRKSSQISGAIDYIGTPGEIVGVQNSGIVVKTGDSSLLLQDLGSQSVAAFRIGSRFGTNLTNVVHDLNQRILKLEKASVDNLSRGREDGIYRSVNAGVTSDDF